MNRLFQKYKRCVVCIVVTDQNGDQHQGTGFHIGGGWIVTARHVVDSGRFEIWRWDDDGVSVGRTLTLPDSNVDLAVVETDFSLHDYIRMGSPGGVPEDTRVDKIPLRLHQLSDRLIMTPVMLLGYPPIPLANALELVAVSGEVNAVVQNYLSPDYPFLIISVTPRGGFSGGPVINHEDVLLGVCTEALERDAPVLEQGFVAAVSIQPLHDLLEANNMSAREEAS